MLKAFDLAQLLRSTGEKEFPGGVEIYGGALAIEVVALNELSRPQVPQLQANQD